jgi:hypothetical protein
MQLDGAEDPVRTYRGYAQGIRTASKSSEPVKLSVRFLHRNIMIETEV